MDSKNDRKQVSFQMLGKNKFGGNGKNWTFSDGERVYWIGSTWV